jgi:hypothetical protein
MATKYELEENDSSDSDIEIFIERYPREGEVT